MSVTDQHDRESEIRLIIAERQPSDKLSHVRTYAELYAKYNITQSDYASITGLSDRTLRAYKAEYLDEFEAEVKKHKPEDEDVTSLHTLLSEEQLYQFISNVFKRSLSPDASVKEWQFLVDLSGLKAEDFMSLIKIKNTSLRWFLKNNNSKVAKIVDPRTLAIMLQESQYLYNGDPQSKGNTQRFIDQDITDKSFQLEVMYYGLLFMSLYNQKAHPDLDLLATAVKVDRIERGIAEEVNMREVRRMAEGKDIHKDKKKKTSPEELFSLLESTGLYKEGELKRFKTQYKEAQAVKGMLTPDLPEAEDVKERASKHKERLLVLTTAEEELKALMQGLLK